MQRIVFIFALLFLIVTFSVSSAQLIENKKAPFNRYLAELSSGEEGDPEIIYADKPEDTLKKGQNPTVALFKSLLIPGWGQIGNKKYIKAGVIIIVESTLIGTIVHYAEKTSDAKGAFEAAEDIVVRAGLFEEFQDARNERNRFSWYTGALIFISMFDAFVDAHLSQFPKTEKKVSLDLIPSEKDHFGVVLSYNF